MPNRPLELRDPGIDELAEAMMAEAFADPARDDLIARRLSRLPADFIARGGKVTGSVLPSDFTHPTIRPKLKGRWRLRQMKYAVLRRVGEWLSDIGSSLQE